MHSKLTSAVVVLAAMLISAGCTAKALTMPNHSAESSIDINAIAYPLDAFDLTDTELATTTQARYSLTQRCVRPFGEELGVLRHSMARAPQDDRYGLADENTARSWAYSSDAPAPEVVPWEVEIDPKSRLFTIVNGVDFRGSPAGIAGLPDGGCRAYANRVLERGTTPEADNPIPELDDRAWHASRQAPAVQNAATEWRRCMKRNGHDYADPVKAPYYFWSKKRSAAHQHFSIEQRKAGIPPTDDERRAALDDVRCKRQSGFLRSWINADIASQRTLIAENLRQLTEHRRILDQVVRNAKQVLA